MSFLKKHLKKNLLLICLLIISTTLVLVIQAPSDYPNGQFNFSVKKGDSISKVANSLKERGIISSSSIFKTLSIILSLNNGVMAGDYKFNERENLIKIVYRMVKGYQKQAKISVTIPEGSNSDEIAYILVKKFPDLNVSHFLSIAKKEEGYLYPDTYYFYENVRPGEIVYTMRNNFNEKIKTLKNEIEEFNKPLSDIITMASIIEGEANNTSDRKIISGVLWKRLREGIPLQVDPPFYYITGKKGNVTYDDLKIDSPYNTYKYKGLPKGPINNPGLDSIKATISPLQSKYYFYLTGKDGAMRYAVTYDGHLNNKNIYLK